MWFGSSRKIEELKLQMLTLATKVNLLETDIANLRGKFNQRLSGKKAREEEPEELDIDEIRKAFGGDTPIELAEKYKNRFS